MSVWHCPPSASDTVAFASSWDAFGFEPGMSITVSPGPWRGASRETLKRRVRYGGRKGRSAARRLRRWSVSAGSWTVKEVTSTTITFDTYEAP